MTIEERANQKYCDKNGDVIDMANDYKRIGYIQGATEQCAIDDAYWTDKLVECAKDARKCQDELIDKACEWLRNDLGDVMEENVFQKMLYRFRKAMEE